MGNNNNRMPKVNKHIERSEKKKTIHPNSRKASALNRDNNKSEKRQMRRDERGEKEKALWEKICWFKEQLVEGKDKYSLYEVSQLIAIYIDRFQARMEEIFSANSLNKQLQRRGANAAAEEAAIKMVREREMNMFITGAFEAPDLTNRTNVKILRKTTDA